MVSVKCYSGRLVGSTEIEFQNLKNIKNMHHEVDKLVELSKKDVF